MPLPREEIAKASTKLIQNTVNTLKTPALMILITRTSRMISKFHHIRFICIKFLYPIFNWTVLLTPNYHCIVSWVDLLNRGLKENYFLKSWFYKKRFIWCKMTNFCQFISNETLWQQLFGRLTSWKIDCAWNSWFLINAWHFSLYRFHGKYLMLQYVTYM